LYFLQNGTHFLANSGVSESTSKVSITAPSSDLLPLPKKEEGKHVLETK
jgi:hypothetical protein